MENKELKVGQRIELYEVLDPSSYPNGVFTKGSVRPCSSKSHHICSLLSEDGDYYSLTHTIASKECILNKIEVKSIGSMIIKSLKNK